LLYFFRSMQPGDPHLTGLIGPFIQLWPEPVRPAPLDGVRPEVLLDFGPDSEFVVDWQVVDHPGAFATPADGMTYWADGFPN
jgi:hypothetical protein